VAGLAEMEALKAELEAAHGAAAAAQVTSAVQPRPNRTPRPVRCPLLAAMCLRGTSEMLSTYWRICAHVVCALRHIAATLS
jgi:hypothetical protein